MKENEDFDWRPKCKECAFYMSGYFGRDCDHPLNERYTALGFRRDAKKVLGIFKSKEVLCGKGAVFFEQKTPESIKAIEAKAQALTKEWNEEARKQKEFNERIDNELKRSIYKALTIDRSFDICFCHSITYNKRNEEGIDVIVADILEKFDIKKKPPAT